MKRAFFLAVLVIFTSFAFGCGSRGGSSDDAPAPATPEATPVVSADKLYLIADLYVLETNGVDEATLTIVAQDSSNAAVADVIVNLAASAGNLSTSQVITDSEGKASVIFSPGLETTNQIVTITAKSGSLETTLPITLIGTKLSLTSSKNSLLAGAGDSAVITVTAKDANGKAIANGELELSSILGNTLTAGGATGPTITVTTNTSGTATATLTATSGPGTETITASGLGAQTSLSLNITSAQFGFTSPPDGSIIALQTSTDLIVTWTDASGTPMSGETLTFTTTGGYFDNTINKTSTQKVTDGNGQATVNYSSGNTASPADIEVTSGTGESDTLRLQRAATNPTQLSLQASPSVLSPSIGGVDSSSTITATVRDPGGQYVANETVVFSLVDGPGGGETLSPGTALTDAGGVASVTFTSGSAVSAKDGVVIRATLLSNPSLYADTTLTIGKQAASIILGSTNKISKVTVDGLEIGYALPFSVLVVDNNGNPIENATVDLGIYPLYFYTGPLDEDLYTGKFRNEDINRNGYLDPGEDGAQGWSDWTALPTDPTDLYWYDGSEDAPATVSPIAPVGIANGKLDPSGVVTIPDNVVTNEDGLAAFEIKYPKTYGRWVDVEIMATALVYGDHSTAKLIVKLGVLKGDEPYANSPFGF